MTVTTRVKDKMLAAAGKRIGPDGIRRPVVDEDELDRIAAQVFSDPRGQKFLAYLKSVTINNLLGPGVGDNELRHMEGQRYLVAIIERRIHNGRQQS